MPVTKEDKPLSEQTVPIQTPEPKPEAEVNPEPPAAEIPRYFSAQTNPDGTNQAVVNVKS